jgi:transposase-like protein
MSDDRDRCGSTETSSGEPCQRSAGWGREATTGPCADHHDGTERDHPGAGGRPTKLTYDRQESIAAAVEDGVPIVAACRENEIDPSTHRRWMNRGEQQDEGVFAEYCTRLARALGYDQRTKTQVLWETAEETGDTATMLTVLKQRYPETWQDQDLGEAQGAVPLVVPDNAMPSGENQQ